MRASVARVTFTLLVLAGFLVVPSQVAVAVGGGVFSVKCVFSNSAQVDPIVAPGPAGTPSEHEHDFFAARNVNSDSTIDSMRFGGTSCPLSVDTAGYWVPSLYKNGVKVKPDFMYIYYRAPSNLAVTPFPADLRIIAGGDTRYPPAPTRPQLSLSWACSDSSPFFPQPPDCGSRKIKAHVHFPDCWDGVNLDSIDHRSHMAYATGKVCPSTHPIALPRLSMHITYSIKNGTGAVLSSDHDQPGGTQLHADFWNTWNQEFLEFLVVRCLNEGKSCKDMNDAKLQAMR